jgi:hypothetical protein
MFRVVMPQLLNESVSAADRVVIGYDDDRRVVTMHDPSFGPALEVSYDAFESMWEPMNRGYVITYPPDATARLSRHTNAAAYRSRSTNERAAFQYVLGYALSCGLNARKEARESFLEGLELPELSPGYRHLFLVELAVLAMSDNNHGSAVKFLREATALVPHHSLPWRMLLAIKQHDPELMRPAESLAASCRLWIARRRWAQKRAVGALPRDVLLYLGGATYIPFDPTATSTQEPPVELKPQGPQGQCPNCEEVIALSAERCPVCSAQFGPNSAWKVIPLE